MIMKNFVILLVLIFKSNLAQYTNQWAVDVHGGQSEADLIAKDTGCTNEGKKKKILTDFSIKLLLG